MEEGNIGYIGFFDVAIFSRSTLYTSNTGNSPGLPNITAIPSILSKSLLQASRITPNCSAVPVARKSMGLPTDEPLNNCSSSASAFGPSRWGISIPPFDSASVSITAGPPA